MNDTEQKRIFLAIVLSGLVLISWQAFFAPKKKTLIPNNSENIVSTDHPESPSKSNITSTPVVKETSAVTNEVTNNVSNISLDEKIYNLVNGVNNISISSSLSISDDISSSSIFPFNEIFNAENPHQFQVIDQSGKTIVPYFDMKTIGENSLEGQDKNLDLKMTATLEDNGKLNINLLSTKAYRYRFLFNASKSQLSSMKKEYVVKLTDVERFTVGDDQEVGDGSAQWFGLDYHYHIFTYVLGSKELVKYQVNNEKFLVETVTPGNELSGYYIFTKKNYDLLSKLGDNLHLSVDFGFFGILAEPILRLLQYIYSFIPNYGWAIIILTLFVRGLTFPLQIKSFKSMKKMQKLQPELAKIKEKFKDDMQRQQKETMELFKKAGANPLGGCFPLLLQMPIFFALYRVLYNAVELVNAPFYLWIKDLSSKDPYYVLPVLMAVSMFGQQKLNPNTSTDATQQKVMMFMPLIFGFFMKDLPAGLNLYIFVSTLFGIISQLAVYRLSDD